MTQKINKQVVLFDTCIALVNLLKIHLDNSVGTHSRIFNYILHPESNYVHAGKSINAQNSSEKHPEHIVPCAVMIQEVKRLISENNLSTKEIATLLQTHWKIVTITKDEAKIIDQELKLKSTMPIGWCFETGDSFARLKKAKIELCKTV